MASIGQIVSLNTAAISKMIAGQLDESAAMLYDAASALRQLMADARAVNDSKANGFVNNNTESRPTTITPLLIEGVPISWDLNPTLLTTGIFPLFNRALFIKIHPEACRLAETSCACAPQNMELARNLAAVLLFNIGLICHCQSIRMGNSREMNKAFANYQAAMASLMTSEQENFRYSSPLLVLALVNNMGYIRSHNFDRKEACGCLDVLRQIFEASEGDSTLNDEDSLFFYITIFMWSREPLSLAPAA